MPPNNALHRVHVIVSGRVQGVGFRYFAQTQAAALGLSGWTKNLAGGDVEAEAQGPRYMVEQWLSALKKGPPLSRVERLDARWIDEQKESSFFDIRA